MVSCDPDDLCSYLAVAGNRNVNAAIQAARQQGYQINSKSVTRVGVNQLQSPKVVADGVTDELVDDPQKKCDSKPSKKRPTTHGER